MHPAEANLSTKDKWKKTLKANTCMASKSRYVRSSVYLQEVIFTTIFHRSKQLFSCYKRLITTNTIIALTIIGW